MATEIEGTNVNATKPWLTYDAPRWMRVVEFWIRTRLFRQQRYLIDMWTVEDGEGEYMYSIDLERDVTEALVKKVRVDD